MTHISIAPMMDWTDRHCRFFHRLQAPSVELWTEMVTANALIHGDAERHLRYDHSEHPVILQLGGSEPDKLAQAITLCEPYGYDGYNLNCGCPSDRVQSGAFGACLMAEPETVAACITAMKDHTDKPVSVKCRIGIDDADEDAMLRRFIDVVSGQGGCTTFIIHARKAWLSGLSPKENRDIPPLNYELVKAIRDENLHLTIHLNGGLTSLDQIKGMQSDYDGFMIGRAAYQSPRFLIDLERAFYNADWQVNDRDVIKRMIAYANDQYDRYGTPIKSVTRHMVNFYQGVKGARQWRQILSENAHKVTRAEDVLWDAFEKVDL